ncbi:MAG: hypothetical protein EOP86_06430 [Verrucomicrobiaceae bacterium]|nr:MAG: hypothetical protein EOP86_06430 [Verrucomicrobiaceae bacterium]
MKYPTPCCRMELTLAELNCEWPQGFAKFAIEVMNAGIGELPDGLAEELARILGTPVRIIHRRL